MLARTYPFVGASCPPGLSEDALVEHGTVGLFGDANERLALCATCQAPQAEAPCDKSGVCLYRPGAIPVWDGDRLVPTRCAKWVEYRIRRRLGRCGVPALYTAKTFRDYKGQEPSLEAILETAARIIAGQSAWLLISGAHQKGKTHLCAAFLRATMRGAPRNRFWYADARALKMTMRRAWKYESNETDPLAPLHEATVLVLENVDPMKLESEAWMHESLENLLYERWTQQRSTVLTTHAPRDALLQSFGNVTTLHEAPACSLV